MAEADTAQDGNEEQTPVAWAKQTPDSRIVGIPKEIVYAGQVGNSIEQNDSTFGIVFEDAQVVRGSLFRNSARDDDTLTAEAVGDDEPRPTDYRIADPSDESVLMAGDTLVTNENGPNEYQEAEAVTDDEVIVWYDGQSGRAIARTLDVHGLPYARYTDDGYLIRGLFQAAEGWREANSSGRSKMAENGKAPRVARLPVLRDEVEGERVMIDISRDGRAYRAHVFDADSFEDEFSSLDTPLDDLERSQYGFQTDAALDWNYNDDAADIIDFDDMMMHHSDGWQEEPDGADTASSSSSGGHSGSDGGAFEVEAESAETNEEGFTERQEQFIDVIVEKVKGTGLTPEERLEGGLETQLSKNSDKFTVVPDVEDVERAVYQRVSHLDVDDLE